MACLYSFDDRKGKAEIKLLLQYLSNPEAGSLRSELVRCAIFLSCGETPQVGQEMKAVFIASMFPQTSVCLNVIFYELSITTVFFLFFFFF